MNDYVPYQGGYTIEEFIDQINTELTVGCGLPKTLPDTAINQIIESRALPWFYRNHIGAVQKVYYLIDRKAFFQEEFTKYSYVNMPCEIQSVVYLYEMKGGSLFQLGVNSPDLSINMGVTNQPYLSSYVSTIGELGVYKSLLSSMSDMLNQLNKFTLKYTFNQLNHRLNILTKVEHSVIVEAYANIPKENLFKSDLFFKYTVGWSKVQLGNMLSLYDFSLPGSIKINGANLVSQGQAEIKEVEEEVKNQNGSSSFFFMVKK